MGTAFELRASAGKRNFSVSLVSENPLALRAAIPAQPEKGHANRELLSRLEKMLGCSVQILSGHTGRKKTLAADCSREHLLKSIAEYSAKQR
ncbi:putative ACR, YggU family [uncultured archaeon]|nr:putative ACR, YggU family [uncultured archaeon]